MIINTYAGNAKAELTLSCDQQQVSQGRTVELIVKCENKDGGIAGISIEELICYGADLDLYSIEIINAHSGWQIFGNKIPFMIVDDSGKNPLINGEDLQFKMVFYVNKVFDSMVEVCLEGSLTDANLEDVTFKSNKY